MLVIAHRGDSAHFPENTCLSFCSALDKGVEGIELDVQQVGDVLYVFHDRDLMRLTGNTGTLETCDNPSQLRVDGQKIPTLAEVLSQIHGQCLLNVEIKNEVAVTHFVTLLRDACLNLGFNASQIHISSFHHRVLKDVHEEAPEFPIGVLFEGIPLNFDQIYNTFQPYSINFAVDYVTKSLVDEVHQLGSKVFVYTVDSAEDIEHLMEIGVDGIFSNDPSRAKQQIENL